MTSTFSRPRSARVAYRMRFRFSSFTTSGSRRSPIRWRLSCVGDRSRAEKPVSALSQTRTHRINPRLSSFTRMRCAARAGRMSAASIAMWGVRGYLVGIVDSSEFLDETRARLCIAPRAVAYLADLARRQNMHLDAPPRPLRGSRAARGGRQRPSSLARECRELRLARAATWMAYGWPAPAATPPCAAVLLRRAQPERSRADRGPARCRPANGAHLPAAGRHSGLGRTRR